MHNKDSRKYWVIAKKVYKKNVKSVGFLLTLIAPIFMAVVPLAIGYFAGSSSNSSETQLAVISEDETLRSLFGSEGMPWTLADDIQSEPDARAAILDESLDAYMVVETGEEVRADLTQVGDRMEMNLPIVEEVLSAYQATLRGTEANLSDQQVGQLLESASLSTESIQVESGEIVDGNLSEQYIQSMFVLIIGFGLYILLALYSNSIVQEIASEKGTRIMEIILSTTSATIHFAGKLTGILLVLATQFLVYIVLIAIGLPYIENLSMLENLFQDAQFTDIIQPTYWYVLTFFVIGLLIYIIFSAFLGSLTNKTEDAGKMLAPIQALTVVGLYSSLFMINGAENLLIKIFSYIPLFTPFVMPMRIVHGQVDTFGITAGIIGSVVFMFALLAVSLYFYRTNVLVYSDSNMLNSLKQSWSLMKSDKASKKTSQEENTTA